MVYLAEKNMERGKTMKLHRIMASVLAAAFVCASLLAGCQEAGDKGEQAGESATEAVDTKDETESRETGKTEETGKEAESSDSTKDVREIQAPRMTKEAYPDVDGSTATIPLSTALYRLVTGASAEEAQTAACHSRTTLSYMRLIHGEADLVLAYEPAESVYDEMAITGQNLIIRPIGKDALVFLVNEGNPAASLTGSQLTRIYTGEYKDWSQVGGEGGEIIAFQRPKGSGSQTLMEKLVMKKLPMAPAPQARVIGEMGELIDQVASYDNRANALGYSVYFYARNMYQRPGLRFMAIDGVLPDNETIKSGDYPYVNEFYTAIREGEPEDSPAYQLFRWLTTEDGQALIEAAGYVGLESADHIHVELDRGETLQPGAVTLKEGSRILLNGDFAGGQGGILVLKEDLSQEKILTDQKMEDDMAYLDRGEALILIDGETELMGLYDVEQERWLADPVYSYLIHEDDGTYWGYRGDERCRLAWREETGIFEEHQGSFQKLGDYWWREEKDGYMIYGGGRFPEKDQAPDKVLDFSDSGFQYGYRDRDYYVMNFVDGQKKLYDCSGTLIFGEEIVGRPVTINAFCPQWVWAADVTGEEEEDSYIYHLGRGQVITRPQDLVADGDADGEHGYFSVIRDGRKQICREDGETVYSVDGKTFDRLIGEGFCGRWENGVLEVEREATAEQYRFSCAENYTAAVVAGNLFQIYDTEWDQVAVSYYRGDQCFMEKAYSGWRETGDALIFYDGDRQLILDRDGRLLYEADAKEAVIGVYPEFLVIRRGNYLCITDYEGNCGFQVLMGYMEDD